MTANTTRRNTAQRRGDRTDAQRRGRALVSVVFLVVVVVGVPATLIVIGAIPHHLPSPHTITASLSRPDNTGVYFRVAAAAVTWIAWAVFTIATLREIVASVRYRGPRPALTVTGIRRFTPAGLVAAIALLVVAAPTVTGLIHAEAVDPHHPEPTPQHRASTDHRETATAGSHNASSRSASAAPVKPGLPRYTVRRYDSLWRIAERHLPGNPAERYRDIRRLNPHIGDDNIIITGTMLTLPADARALPHDSGTVVVRPGDTLSGIAAEHGTRSWTELWHLNRGRTEPDGRRFSDPNLIDPGWTIRLDQPAHDHAPEPRHRDHPRTPPQHNASPHGRGSAAPPATPTGGSPSAPRTAPATPTADPTSTNESPTPQPTSASVPTASATRPEPTTDHTARSTAGSIAGSTAAISAYDAIFAGAGALLAAGLLSRLVLHRREQHRFRRPGRTIHTPPLDTIPAERALITHAHQAEANVEFLDLALRSLAVTTATDPDGVLPDVIAAQLTGAALILNLASPHHEPPAPWITDEHALSWIIAVDADLAVTRETAHTVLAPYPTLVTIGDDQDGATWLIDLERVGTLTLTGDQTRATDLARFIAAELACNAWSDHLDIALCGPDPDLCDLNSARLRHEPDATTAIADLREHNDSASRVADTAGVDVLSGRLRQVAGDTWMPKILICTQPSETFDADDRKSMNTQRLPTAIVDVSRDVPLAGCVADIDPTGTLRMPSLGLQLSAPGLPREQVPALAQLIQYATDLDDQPMPDDHGDKIYHRYGDASGNLAADLREPRTAEVSALTQRPASAQSLLPLDDADYVATAATTQDDLQTLAPNVNAQTRNEIHAADPTLDEDLALWHNPDCPLPRLTLLGPVELRVPNERSADISRRIAYYTELTAYLATRDHGATTEQIAAAFNIAPATVYGRLATLKNWLGTNPRTGQRHLPDATQSTAARARGVGVYVLDGLLVDADLFKRLRLRAHANGPDGITHLQDALSLVTGAPFDQLRPGGYEWLTDGNRLDHIYPEAIVDVAHTVTTTALAQGDIETARTATEIAFRAAPYEEIPQLDHAAIRRARGEHADAQRHIHEHIDNRDDGHDAPGELPKRTAQILQRR